MPGGGDSETVSKQELSEEQKMLLGLAMPFAEQYANKPLEMYSKSVIPGFTDRQVKARGDLTRAGEQIGRNADKGFGTAQTGQNQTVGAARQGRGLVSQATDPLLRAGTKGVQGLGQVLGDYSRQGKGRELITSGALLKPGSNPATKGMINAAIRPVQQQLTEQILPGIRSEFVGGNSFGSSRQGIAEGLAMRGFSDAATDATSNIVNNNYNQGLGAMVSGLNAQTGAASAGVGQGLGAGGTAGGLGASLAGTGMGNMAQILNTLPGLGNLSMSPGLTGEAIGESQRQLQGAKMGEKSDRFNIKQMLPFMQAQQLAGLAFGMPGGSATTSTQQNPSMMSQVGGAGLGILGLMQLLPMLSDIRLKRDIKFTHNDGKYNWYEFKYAFDDEAHKGVMAHEVAEINPDAVQNIGGYQVVNYGAL